MDLGEDGDGEMDGDEDEDIDVAMDIEMDGNGDRDTDKDMPVDTNMGCGLEWDNATWSQCLTSKHRGRKILTPPLLGIPFD